MTLFVFDLVKTAKEVINEVSVEKAKNMLEDNTIALDVREPAEFESGHINNARHLPRGVLEFKIADHPDFQDLERSILVYCKTGGRSALAAVALQQLGYLNAYSLAGGFDAWQQYE
ncbi:MAG: rhodanese-like domain-containing protein [Gammaproteobacteria bacterium]|nr:rhodanese-like domain-containing protein [Gammaproteobacteria bacterium]